VIYLAWFIVALAGIQCIISLVNLLSFHHLPEKSIDHTPLVSVLIPARNEEMNIAHLLSDLIALPYKNLDILVYDDESTDHTKRIVMDFEQQDPRVRLLSGIPLPEHFIGKNHACYQLALHAHGEYFLFLDADVRVKGALIERALFRLINKDLSLLSIFPVQHMQTVGEKISIPLMNWILLSLLPLPLIHHSKRPSLAAANGQFMLFPAEIYKEYQFHHQFKGDKVEDVAIIRFLKKERKNVDTLLGKDDISCRMYSTLEQAMNGFSKNIFLFFGNSIALTLLYAMLITLAPAIVFSALPWKLGMAFILLILAIRINISLASRQPLWQNLMYLVPQHIVFLTLIVHAMYHRITRELLWKNRNVLDI
jgi:cellulose synthase/poly-beta-1,6-N-acetylglucosamine synthase-like glycosyltransferase